MVAMHWSLAACLATLTLGLRRYSKRTSTVVSLAEDCSPLQNLTVRGIRVGIAAHAVCESWPADKGEFPIGKVDRAIEIFEKGFGEGGIYDQLKEVARSRGRNAKFCWKDLKLRDPATPSATAMTGLAQLNVSASEILDHSQALFIHRRRRRRRGIPAGCEAFDNGKCYGSCPRGFEPTKLLDKFAPVCKSDCRVSPFTRKCGFGCSTDTRACVSVVMDQVGQVLNAVAGVASYLTGNPAIAQVVEKLLQLVDFIIEVIFTLIKTARGLWKSYKESETLAGFLSVFVSFLFENAEQFGQTLSTAKKLFGEVVGFWFDMLDGGFKFSEDPLDKLAEALSKHGAKILDSAVSLVKAFVYPKCER